MGILTIIPQDERHDSILDSTRRIMEKRGFAPPRELTAAGQTLLLHPPLVAGPALVVEGGDGEFAAAAGTFFYAGLYGLNGLQRLLEEARDGVPADEHFSGCYVVALHIAGRLTVFTDRLGFYKFYRTSDSEIWSSSFLACCAALDTPVFNAQAVYEYVFQGATYGADTLVTGIEQVAPDERHIFAGDQVMRRESRPFPFELTVDDSPMETHVARVADTLGALYTDLYRNFGREIGTALSGGYDSRLTLALLRQQGTLPDIHVYGSEWDPDVLVAKAIAEGEGFALHHDNKERLGDPSPEGVARAVADQFWAFDGCPTDGIVGTGSDLATRRARAERDGLALNGGGGEVFRNFFYLRNRTFSLRDVIQTFYSQYDPAITGPRFNEAAYTERLAAKIAGIFPEHRETLSRTEVEYVYPGFRGRFWTGRNTTLNNHLGPALTPFFEVPVVADALRVPLHHKNHGGFEAALIRHIDPRLAAYPSAYGHDFAGPPPLSHRLKDWGTYLRPPWLRKYTYRIKKRRQPPVSHGIFSGEYRALYLPDGTPRMQGFFHVDRLADAEQLNRVLTLEYLGETMGVGVE